SFSGKKLIQTVNQRSHGRVVKIPCPPSSTVHAAQEEINHAAEVSPAKS
ncbi:hypothetical protein G7L34_26545, partial [Klebsiella quasipneumoniae]|nr:hypothetical protein [Klebsiella quasipneumoniae]